MFCNYNIYSGIYFRFYMEMLWLFVFHSLPLSLSSFLFRSLSRSLSLYLFLSLSLFHSSFSVVSIYCHIYAVRFVGSTPLGSPLAARLNNNLWQFVTYSIWNILLAKFAVRIMCIHFHGIHEICIHICVYVCELWILDKFRF